MGVFQTESVWSSYLKILALVYIGRGDWQLVTGQLERIYDEAPAPNPEDDDDTKIDKFVASQEYVLVDHFIEEKYSQPFNSSDFSNAKKYCEEEGWASSPDFVRAWMNLLMIVSKADFD